MLAFLRTGRQIRLHILQHRVFGQVVLYDLGNIRIQRFVIRHTSAKCIRQRHIPRTIGVEQPRYTKDRISTKRQWIDEVVIHTPVNHVHAP